MQIGRRIFYNKSNGEILVELGEMTGDVLERNAILEVGVLDLAFGQNSDEFSRVKKYHVDITTQTVVFDELNSKIQTDAEKIAELENKLLETEGLI